MEGLPCERFSHLVTGGFADSTARVVSHPAWAETAVIFLDRACNWEKRRLTCCG